MQTVYQNLAHTEHLYKVGSSRALFDTEPDFVVDTGIVQVVEDLALREALRRIGGL